MSKVKRKVYVIAFLFAFILFFNIKSCYANHFDDMVNKYKNGQYVEGSQVFNANQTIFNANDRFFCVSKGFGNNSLTEGARYYCRTFYKIGKDGVTVYFNGGSVNHYLWEDIRGQTSFYPTAKMYCILNSHDKYGTHLVGSKYGVADKENLNFYSYKQIAIYGIIDSFMESYFDYNNKTRNSKNNTVTTSEEYSEWDIEIGKKAFTLNEDSIENDVYIWYYSTDDEPDGKFWQNLILAGEKKEGTTNPTYPNIQPTSTSAKLKLKKIDKDTKQPLSGVQFGLTRNKGTDDKWDYVAFTGSDGWCYFNDITPGCTYYLYETYNPNPGYNLSKQSLYTYDSNIGRLEILEFYAVAGEEYSIKNEETDNCIVNEKTKGSITITKRDKKTYESIPRNST